MAALKNQNTTELDRLFMALSARTQIEAVTLPHAGMEPAPQKNERHQKAAALRHSLQSETGQQGDQASQ